MIIVSWSCIAAALSLTLVGASATQAADRPIGLLALHELSGAVCQQPPPRELPLYAAPNSADILGWIRADKQANADAECYTVMLNVHRPGGTVSELPTKEYEEEEYDAAIVLEQRGRWFKVRLSDGTAWLHASEANEYFSLQQLLVRRPAYLTDAWDGKLSATPEGPSRRPPADPRRRVIGYVEPTPQEVQVVLHPGQDAEQIREEIRKRYNPSSMGSRSGPGGTHVLYAEKGMWLQAFERPDRRAAVVARFRTDRCDAALRTTGQTPQQVAVFDRRPGWLQVSPHEADWRKAARVWIEDSSAWRFHAVNGEDERVAFAERLWGREHPSVRFLDSRDVRGRLWLQIEVMSHTIYDSDEPPEVVAAGWVPAHDSNGELIVWAYSRD